MQAALWLVVLVFAQLPLGWGATSSMGPAAASLDVPAHDLSQHRVASGAGDGIRLKAEGNDPVEAPPATAAGAAPSAVGGARLRRPACFPAPAAAPAHGYEACGPPPADA